MHAFKRIFNRLNSLMISKNKKIWKWFSKRKNSPRNLERGNFFFRGICSELQQPMKFISPSEPPVGPLAQKSWKVLSTFSPDSFQTTCLDQKMPKHNPIRWLWLNIVYRKQRPSPSLNLDTGAIFPSWFYQIVGGIQKFQKVERESLIIDTLSKHGVQCWGRFLGQ